MKTSRFQKVALALTGAVLAASGSSAFAAWTFNNVNPAIDGTGATAVRATATAYSVANTTATSGVFSSSTAFVASSVNFNGTNGLGVYAPGETSSAGNAHAVDNANGYTDMLLFSFTYSATGAAALVDLNSFNIGWSSPDADVSLLRYKGTSAPGSIAGKTWTQLKTAGWELVSDFNVATNSAGAGTGTVTGDKVSSWWIVSAFNTGFGGSVTATNGLTLGNDYFKLASLSGTLITTSPGTVPEPGSLALMGLAMVGLIGARRRSARSSK